MRAGTKKLRKTAYPLLTEDMNRYELTDGVEPILRRAWVKWQRANAAERRDRAMDVASHALGAASLSKLSSLMEISKEEEEEFGRQVAAWLASMWCPDHAHEMPREWCDTWPQDVIERFHPHVDVTFPIAAPASWRNFDETSLEIAAGLTLLPPFGIPRYANEDAQPIWDDLLDTLKRPPTVQEVRDAIDTFVQGLRRIDLSAGLSEKEGLEIQGESCPEELVALAENGLTGCWRLRCKIRSGGSGGATERRIRRVREDLISVLLLVLDPSEFGIQRRDTLIAIREGLDEEDRRPAALAKLGVLPLLTLGRDFPVADRLRDDRAGYLLRCFVRGNHSRLLNAVRYQGLARLATMPDVQMVFTASSIDALFHTGDHVPLQKWLALSSALLEAPENRKARMTQVEGLYNCRSEILHRGLTLGQDAAIVEQLDLARLIVRLAVDLVREKDPVCEDTRQGEDDLLAECMRLRRLGLDGVLR